MDPLIIAGICAVVVIVGIGLFASMFKQVPPNKALIIYGLGGTKIVTGGGHVVLPVVQGSQELSLELMSFDVAPETDLYTSQGVAVSVEAVTQIKVKNDPESIRTAAEQFLVWGVSLPPDSYGIVKNNMVNVTRTMPDAGGAVDVNLN